MNNVEMHTFVEKLSLENKKKNELFFCISLAYLYLFALQEDTFRSEIKRKTSFHFVFRSLICTFVAFTD